MIDEQDLKMIEGDFDADRHGLMYSNIKTNKNSSLATGFMTSLCDDNTNTRAHLQVTPIKYHGTTYYQNIESANINLEFGSNSTPVGRSSSAGNSSHGYDRGYRSSHGYDRGTDPLTVMT